MRIDRVTKSFGETQVLRDLSLTVRAGTMLALLGPSGCGKSTLLRIVAGLETPDSGVVAVGGQTLTDGPDVMPPERRRVGLVFQDWALFPHLNVAANVAYGLRDMSGAQKSQRVREALDMVGLPDLAERAPATLSGGQQQRVALARAFAPRPAVLLLDEPFSNLDAALRGRVRTEIHALLVELGITTVFVTHDQEEAFVLGNEVAVVRDGAVVQQGDPASVYAGPADRWVAEFVGEANIVAGDADGELVTTALGVLRLARAVSGPVDVLVRPEALALEPDGTDVRAVVELVEFYGHDTVSFVRLVDGAVLRVRTPGPPRAGIGAVVSLRYAGGDAVAFDRQL